MSDNVDQREVWLPVVGYEGLYEVSNLGRVRRDYRAPARSLGVPGKVLTPNPGNDGYPHVDLSNAGVVTKFRVHRLVLTAFCGKEPFPGAQAAHNDGDRSNVKLDNLRWATPAENQWDRIRHGTAIRGERVQGAKLNRDQVGAIRRGISEGMRNAELATEFRVSTSTIHLIRHNKIWRHVA